MINLATITATPSVDPDALPKCNACHKAPVTMIGYSTCRPCREKRSEKKRESNERKRRRKMALLQDTFANLPKAPLAGESSKSLKRKADTKGENAADAMDRMQKRFKKMEVEPVTKAASKVGLCSFCFCPFLTFVPFQTSSAPSDPTDPTDPVFEKFVIATDLHKDIKRRYPDNSTSLRFYGTYAIIAFPDIGNKERTRIVARDLKQSTGLHFRCAFRPVPFYSFLLIARTSLEDRKSHRSADAVKTYTSTYHCTCRAAPSAFKRSGSDLASYFAPKPAPATSTEAEQPKTECRGRIVISAEDDWTHPLGWLGQRVKVTVTHPKKA
jgi:hypothetical protein